MSAKDISVSAVLTSLALVFSYLETLIPVFVAVPGMKVGLANIVIIFALYKFGFRRSAFISFLRVIIAGLLFGTAVTLVYSAAGALISLTGMFLLKKTGVFSVVSVSITGALLHNAAQFVIAFFLLKTDLLIYYLPFLIIGSLITGAIIGLLSAILIKRVRNS